MKFVVALKMSKYISSVQIDQRFDQSIVYGSIYDVSFSRLPNITDSASRIVKVSTSLN